MLDSSSPRALGPLAVLLLGKSLRGGFLGVSHWLLHHVHVPAEQLSFILVALVAVGVNVYVRPWRAAGSVKRSLSLFLHAFLLAAGVVAFHVGLAHYGPLKALLAVDFADVALHYLLRLFADKRDAQGRGFGVLFTYIGYVVLLWLDAPETALAC